MVGMDDYRQVLKNELDNRCRTNPRYSLRAFARDLEIAPSRLSEILNHKQGLSPQGASRIADTLGLQLEEKDYFCDLVSAQHARSQTEREVARIRLLKRQTAEAATYQLKLDTFKIIADWYHMGLLELLNIKGFQHDTAWIARQLKITPIQVELAIERLERVRLLRRVDGRLVAAENTGWLEGGVPSESIKKFHKQILQRAAESLVLQSVEERDFSANIMSIDRNELPLAKKQIREFQKRFCDSIQTSEQKDAVYCLSVQFFNLAGGGL